MGKRKTVAATLRETRDKLGKYGRTLLQNPNAAQIVFHGADTTLIIGMVEIYLRQRRPLAVGANQLALDLWSRMWLCGCAPLVLMDRMLASIPGISFFAGGGNGPFVDNLTWEMEHDRTEAFNEGLSSWCPSATTRLLIGCQLAVLASIALEMLKASAQMVIGIGEVVPG